MISRFLIVHQYTVWKQGIEDIFDTQQEMKEKMLHIMGIYWYVHLKKSNMCSCTYVHIYLIFGNILFLKYKLILVNYHE